MKALTQVIGSGACTIRDIPSPQPRPGSIVVASRASLISSGTETSLLDFGRSGLLGKVRSQPDKVRQVLDKVATDGIAPTLAAVRDKLGDTIAPGYCQAGIVLASGDADAPFAIGDRVVTNGPHAEVVRVPYHLAARIPEDVDFESAAFTPLAAIALQGLRLARPTLGETIVVFGLGLVGQLAVQLVRAQGCRCIGIDVDPQRVALAETFGAHGLVAEGDATAEIVRELTRGVGADAVLMTLATDSDEPMHLAAEMSRKRGRIVLVGVTGLRLRRADFYEKELTFQVSCSYGPGRYDRAYEEGGRDYPLAYVRWTEQRNFEAVLALMSDGSLDTAALVSHRFEIDDAPDAYELLLGDEPTLAILLTYPENRAIASPESAALPAATIRVSPGAAAQAGPCVAGILGAGSFARRTLIPAIRAAGYDIRSVVSSRGLSAAVEADRAGARLASSDVEEVFGDPLIDTAFVLTRHDSHAELAIRGLESGKHVFVEKPLALDHRSLEDVRLAADRSGRILMVGFNRRFAPLAIELRSLVGRRAGPLSLVVTVNAGRVDRDHWVQDPDVGGGRIVGEACHFIDLARFLVATSISDLTVVSASDSGGRCLDDVSHIALSFEDGSTAAIHYLSTGSSRFPKERIEAFFDGRTAAIDNWRRMHTWGISRRRRLLPRAMDKGHGAELVALAAAVRGDGPHPIPSNEIFEVSSWSIRAAELARGRDRTAS